MSVFLIFSDDWGRHPSSCQHLTRRLMSRGNHRVYWVNTIGTRPPGWNLLTLRRGLGKIRSWFFDSQKTNSQVGEKTASSENEPAPRILHPFMYPWFRRGFDRRLNRFLMSRAINHVLAKAGETDVTAITTLPITADLPGELPAVKRWVYYCVDDWSLWPGMDARPLAEMEAELIRKVDRIVTAGENLHDRIQSLGRESLLLTHGIDLEFWHGAQSSEVRKNPQFARDLPRPVFTFWGLIDERLDPEMVERLSQDVPQGSILFAGPVAAPEVAKRLEAIPNARLLGMVPYEKLPRLAAESDVLIMPYRKNETTEQIQPLKMTEYLASGRPAVVRALRASHPWADALDEADSPETFSRLARFRALSGLPETQASARKRLESETWDEKTRQFEAYILEDTTENENISKND
ncbi:MAG: glycosyltransferase [Thermoguttaceae bacterium]|nr:glycosyltransferase [Thermoguttaceae bacterium]